MKWNLSMIKTFPIEQFVKLIRYSWNPGTNSFHERVSKEHRYIFIKGIFVNRERVNSYFDRAMKIDSREKKGRKKSDDDSRVCYLVYGKLFDAYVL